MDIYENYEYVENGICSPQGFSANAVNCGFSDIKAKPDLALVVSGVPCKAAMYFTRNKFKGAPLTVSRQALVEKNIRGVLINSNNANCNKFEDDITTALMCVNSVSDCLDGNFLNISVGSVNVPFNPDYVINSINTLISGLSPSGSESAANVLKRDTINCIPSVHTHMTENINSTVKNQYALKFKIGKSECTIGGIVTYGAGCDMDYAGNCIILTCDVNIPTLFLSAALKYVSRLTLDMKAGNPTINDAAVILSSCQAKNRKIIINTENYDIFVNALHIVMTKLVKQMMLSARGKTKLLECVVKNAYDEISAKNMVLSTINSPNVIYTLKNLDKSQRAFIHAIGSISGEFARSEMSIEVSTDKGNIVLMREGEITSSNNDSEYILDVLSSEEIKLTLTTGEGNYDSIGWGSL